MSNKWVNLISSHKVKLNLKFKLDYSPALHLFNCITKSTVTFVMVPNYAY